MNARREVREVEDVVESARDDELADAHRHIAHLADELARARKKEIELIRLKAALLSRANHEFRTPLTIIDGVASRMSRQSDKLSPTEIEARCDSIRSSVSDLLSLTNSMLNELSLDLSTLTGVKRPDVG